MIGLHLLVDAVTSRKVSKELIQEILLTLPQLIDMNILDGPHIVQGVQENPGWTGFEIIDKSHIAIHTFSKTNTISVDVYSCKSFNAKKIVEYLKNCLSLDEVSARTITREIASLDLEEEAD